MERAPHNQQHDTALAVLLLDRAGVIRAATPAACDALGQPASKLVTRAVHHVLPAAKALVYLWLDALQPGGDAPPPRVLDLEAAWHGQSRRFDGILYALGRADAAPDQPVAGLVLRPSLVQKARTQALDAQRALLSQFAQGATLRDSLREVALFAERQMAGETFCVVVLDDGRGLERGVVATLPADMADLYADPAIHAQGCPAALAMADEQPVVIPDLDADTRFRAYAAHLRRHSLRAVWSQPVPPGAAATRATLDILLPIPRSPSAEERHVAEQVAAMVRLALDLAHLRAELERRTANLSSIVGSLPVVVWETDAAGVVTLIEGGALPLVKLHAASVVGHPSSEAFGASDTTVRLVHRALEGVSEWSDVAAFGRDFTIQVTPIRDARRARCAACVAWRWTSPSAAHWRPARWRHAAWTRWRRWRAALRAIFPTCSPPSAAMLRWQRFRRASRRGWQGKPGDHQAAAARGQAATQNMLALGQPKPIRRTATSVAAVLREALQLLRPVLPPQIAVDVVDQTQGQDQVMADPNLLQQVLFNLLMRGRDAMPSGGTLRVRMERDQRPGASPALRVSVEDSGPPLPPELLPRIFDAFGTAGENTAGLAMALVRSFVESNGGRVEVLSGANAGAGVGTSVVLTLPAAALPSSEAGGAARGAVLLGEAHPLLRPMLAEALQSAGYHVTAPADPQAFRAALSSAQGQMDTAVVVDPAFLASTPAQAVQAIRRLAGPDVPILLAGDAPTPGSADSRVAALPKPLDLDALRHQLAAFLPARGADGSSTSAAPRTPGASS
ncbi:MAG: ATP-binding protein [Phycisphaerales bacterium]